MLEQFQVITSTGTVAPLAASYETDSRKNPELPVMQGLQSSVLGSGSQVAQLTPQQQQIFHSQRIPPLGTEQLEEEMVYVNPQQYSRIIKRRLARARLVAKGRIQKERPKYLYKTRHLHAKNRARGEGGRFYSGSVKDDVTMHSKLSTDPKTKTDSATLGGHNGIYHLTGGVASLQLFSLNGQASNDSNNGLISEMPLKTKSISGKTRKMGRRL